MLYSFRKTLVSSYRYIERSRAYFAVLASKVAGSLQRHPIWASVIEFWISATLMLQPLSVSTKATQASDRPHVAEADWVARDDDAEVVRVAEAEAEEAEADLVADLEAEEVELLRYAEHMSW
jgi:hypothetical protein